jgi:hypothetical protein
VAAHLDHRYRRQVESVAGGVLEGAGPRSHRITYMFSSSLERVGRAQGRRARFGRRARSRRCESKLNQPVGWPDTDLPNTPALLTAPSNRTTLPQRPTT